MKIQAKNLWKVPVYCAVASWISFYITAYLGQFFFVVKEIGTDGVVDISVDPVRSAIFNGVLFLLILLTGGLWAFRNMSKQEIIASSAIASAIYLLIALCELMIKGFSFSLILTYIQNWISIPNSFIYSLSDNLAISAIISSFSPLLFILFGKKRIEETEEWIRPKEDYYHLLDV